MRGAGTRTVARDHRRELGLLWACCGFSLSGDWGGPRREAAKCSPCAIKLSFRLTYIFLVITYYFMKQTSFFLDDASVEVLEKYFRGKQSLSASVRLAIEKMVCDGVPVRL